MSRWLLLSLLIVVLVSPGASRARASTGGEAGMAPSFTLPGRTGPVSLASLRGHVVYVDFWASWCGPCQMSFPWMTQMYDRYARKGLVIVAVDLDKDHRAAEHFLDRHMVPFLVAFDPAGKTAEAFDVEAMPSSYLVGPDGRMISRR